MTGPVGPKFDRAAPDGLGLTAPEGPRVVVGGFAAGYYKTFITALAGEGKQANRAFGAREMHPYPRLRRYFPRRGKF